MGIESSDLTLDEIERLRPAVYEHISVQAKETEFMKVHDAWTPPLPDEPVDMDHVHLAAVCRAENLMCEYTERDSEADEEIQHRDFTRIPTPKILSAQPVQAQAVRALRMPPYVEHLGRCAVQTHLLRNGHLTRRIEHWVREGAPRWLTYRYPLLDRRIAEFVLGLPDEMYFFGGRSRGFFRVAAAAFLSVDILHGEVKTEPALVRRHREVGAALRRTRDEWE